MASRTLRPLSVGEILDAGVKVVVRHWKVLAICVVGLVGPMNVLQVLVRASIDPDAFESGTTSTTTSADVGPALAGLVGSTVLSGLAFLVAFTACFKAVADAWLGAEPEVGRSLRFGARRLGSVLWAWIVWAVALALAFLALVVPWVYLIVAWCLTLPALLFEGLGPFKAMGRSRSLVKGRWWPTLALVLVGYLLVSIVGGIIEGVLVGIAGASSSSVVPAAIATVIGATVSNAITTPYLAAVLTILYFDMRVRKEGFDLQLMAADLGPLDPDAPLPAPLIGEPAEPPAPEPAHASWQPPSAEHSPERPESRPPPEPRRPDPDRADWLPPEAPRGPGGL